MRSLIDPTPTILSCSQNWYIAKNRELKRPSKYDIVSVVPLPNHHATKEVKLHKP